jgi:hypothetical protein
MARSLLCSFTVARFHVEAQSLYCYLFPEFEDWLPLQRGKQGGGGGHGPFFALTMAGEHDKEVETVVDDADMVAWRNLHENLQVMLRGGDYKASLDLLLAAEEDEDADEELVAWSLAHLRLQTITTTRNSAAGPLTSSSHCSRRTAHTYLHLYYSSLHR